MLRVHFRFLGTAAIVLLATLLARTTLAQSLSSAGTSAALAPYSPVVSFGTLPVLQATTPIPGSSHVPSDFNGDGTSDLLWFNPSLSEVGYWTMTTAPIADNGGVTRTGIHTFKVAPGYFVGAMGDFNDDGYSDLIFTSANRDLYLWTNNQSGGFTARYIGTYPSNWQLVGAGDVDGDGYDDLLWLDPSDCQFAYWTMRGSVRTGYKVIPITCGYYPMGIGYYTPSNRISILWTSALNDLYIWDSTEAGFHAYNLSPYINIPQIGLANVWAFGGGFMGANVGIEWTQGSPMWSYGGLLSRQFDSSGNQLSAGAGGAWDGSVPAGYASAGYLIEGNGANATAIYFINQANATISTNGLQNEPYDTVPGNAEIPPGRNSWNYPVGWWVVGAPSNGTIAPPWQ